MAIEAGVGFVEILPRTEAFTGALLTKVSAAMKVVSAKVGGEATALGRTIGSGIALPVVAGLAAAGVAVTKLASDYEDSIIRLRTLVGIGAEDVDHLSEAVLRLATTLPQSPKELADALFFITSAGQRGEVAMETLRVSAQAAASGLGETKVVADAVTSAMNAYADSGLTAADATDIMIKAVAEGKFPPEELAASLGQVLPVASQLGVEFEQVLAAIAGATRQGLAFNRAATGTRFLLSAFTKPSQQAVEALAKVGLTLEELQASLAEKGLLPTLQELAKRFDLTTAAGKQAFATVVGGARGLSVALIQVGANSDAVEKLTASIADFAGTGEKAFAIASQTLTNRLQTLGSTLQVVGIEIGNVLIPVVSQLVSLLGTLAGAVLVPLAENFKTLLTVFLGYKVLTSFLPALLLRLAVGFEAIGAAVASERLLLFGEVLQGLKTPLLAIPAAFFVLSKVIGARQQADIERYSARIAQFGVESDKSEGAVRNLSAAIARQQGVGFRAFISTEQQQRVHAAVQTALSDLDEEHRKTAILQTDIQTLGKQAERSARGIGGNVRFIATAVGQSFTEFTGSLRGALAKSQTDVRAWGKFVGATLSKATEFFADWRDQAAQSLTGVGDVLSGLANDTKLTADKVLTAFGKAARETRAFAEDLLTIGKTGGESGKQLASALLQLGPSARGLADVVASAGEDMRGKIVRQFGDILSAGEDGASKLQRVLVGTLKEIRDILAQIAKSFGIHLDSNAPKVKDDLEFVRQKLQAIDGMTANATVTTRFVQIGETPTFKPPAAAGGIIAGQAGFITRGPTFLVGESRKQTFAGTGTEAILPFDDRGIGILAEALRRAMGRGDGERLPSISIVLEGERVGRLTAPHVSRTQRRHRQLVGG
jgi:TP901 family phage tail tape measure protein